MTVLSNLVVIVLMTVFFLAVCGLGALVLGALKAEPAGGGEYIIFSFAAGAVLFSLMLLGLGRAGLFNRPVMAIFTAAVLGAAVFRMKKVLVSIKVFSAELGNIRGLFFLAAALLLLPRLLASFFSVFIPPIAWDTMAYHYAIPYIYKTAGKAVYIPFMMHSNWPECMEMAYTWAMIIHNDILANGVSFVYSFMMLVAVAALGAKMFNPGAGFTAAAVLASFLYFKIDSADGYVEAGLAFFEVSAVYAAFMYTRTKEFRYITAGAVCAGGAASVKILGLFPGAFLPAFILFADYLPGGGRKKIYLRDAVLFGLAALAIASPWYIKSWAETGNPVWPFAYSIFGGRNWTPDTEAYLISLYSNIGGGKNLLQFLMLPVKLIYSRHMDGFIGSNIIYLYLMLPFVFYSIIKRKDAAQAFLAVYSFVFVVFWFAGTQMTRFFFPGMAVMTVMAAGETERIMREGKNKALKFITAAAVIYLLLYSYPVRNLDRITGLNCFLGLYDRESFLKSNLDYYALFSRVNADDGIKGRIVLFRDIRGYYLKKDYMWGDPVNQGIITYKSTEQTLKQLEQNKVEYVIYNNRESKEGTASYTGTVRKIMEEIITHHADLLYCENGDCIYRLK